MVQSSGLENGGRTQGGFGGSQCGAQGWEQMGGFELLLLGLLPLALLAAVSDTDPAADTEDASDAVEAGDGAGEERVAPGAAPHGETRASLLDDDDAPAPWPSPMTEDAASRTLTATEEPHGPASAIWPESDWPDAAPAAADMPHPGHTEHLSMAQNLAGAEGMMQDHADRGPHGAGTSGRETAADGASAAELAPAAAAGTDDAGDGPAQPAVHRSTTGQHGGAWPAQDWPEFALATATDDETVLHGTQGADRLVAGDGGAVLHANWTPELVSGQGSDLFAWRDDQTPDTLIGGASDDRMIFARGDSATGGGGANLFEIWNDPGSPHPPARISDFTPAGDRIDIVMKIDEAAHPDCGTWDWDRSTGAALFEAAQVEIRRDIAANLTEILIDGVPAAHLAGAPAVSEGDLRILAFWDIHS